MTLLPKKKIVPFWWYTVTLAIGRLRQDNHKSYICMGYIERLLHRPPPPPKWNYPSLFLKGHDLVHPDLKQLELYIWSKTIQLNLTLGLLLEEVEHRGFDLEAAKSKEVNMECSGQAEVSSLRVNYQRRQEHTEMERCD